MSYNTGDIKNVNQKDKKKQLNKTYSAKIDLSVAAVSKPNRISHFRTKRSNNNNIEGFSVTNKKKTKTI